MKRAALHLFAVLLLALLGASAYAEPVPEEGTGIWGETGCDGGGRMFLVNSSYTMIIRSTGGSGMIAVAPVEWAAGALVVSAPGGMLVLPVDTMERCRALPPLLYAGFGEAVALFRDYDGIRPRCDGGSPPSCAIAVFAALDITGDDRLSEAEVGRLVRAAGFFLAYWIIVSEGGGGGAPSFVSFEKLYGSTALSVVVGSYLTANLVRTYDYDGDGFLSLEELMQDRLPEHLAGIAGSVGSVATTAALDAMFRNLPGVIEGVAGLAGLLGSL